MDISGGIKNPVNMYGTSTGNNINLAIESENKLYGSNIFSSEFVSKEAAQNSTIHTKKKRKSKRLNTIDSNFLPDETTETPETTKEENSSNFFVKKDSDNTIKKFKKAIDYFFTSAPLINYFYLRHKEKKIQMTVETLNDIIQNADELLNTTVPYGENGRVYDNIAQNLTNAASVIGKANKEF